LYNFYDTVLFIAARLCLQLMLLKVNEVGKARDMF